MKVFWAVLLLTAGSAGALPGEARIADLQVIQEGAQIKASFQLVDAFGPDFLERIQSGLPTELVYRIRLEKARRWWFDNTIERSALQVVVMYNAVTREYLVNFKHEGRLIDSRVVQEVEELERTMTIFHALPVFNFQDSPPTGRLTLGVRAELGSRNILLLIPTKIHTEWAESGRFRAAAPESP